MRHRREITQLLLCFSNDGWALTIFQMTVTVRKLNVWSSASTFLSNTTTVVIKSICVTVKVSQLSEDKLLLTFKIYLCWFETSLLSFDIYQSIYCPAGLHRLHHIWSFDILKLYFSHRVPVGWDRWLVFFSLPFKRKPFLSAVARCLLRRLLWIGATWIDWIEQHSSRTTVTIKGANLISLHLLCFLFSRLNPPPKKCPFVKWRFHFRWTKVWQTKESGAAGYHWNTFLFEYASF